MITHVGEQPFQHSDRIRHLGQPGEDRKEPGQRRIVEGKETSILHHLPHELTPLVHVLPLLLPLRGLDLGKPLTLTFQLFAGQFFCVG